MNLYKLSIVGALFLLIICFMFDLQEGQLKHFEKERMQYTIAVESATDDALAALVQVNNGIVNVQEEEAVDTFYHSFSSNLAKYANNQSYQWIDIYIPVIMVTKPAGVRFFYSSEYEGAEGKQLKKVWSETYPYVYREGNYIVSFQLVKDEVTVFNVANNDILICTLKEAANIGGMPVFSSDPEAIKQKTIVETVEKYLEYYVNEHNRIAQHFDVQYTFYVPYIDSTNERTLRDISLSVLFQGYPMSGGRFNLTTFSAARIRKNDLYYLTNGANGKRYHRYDCPLIGGTEIPENEMVTKKADAARRGAYPCSTCYP